MFALHTILVVEDEEDIRAIIVNVLTRPGCEVLEAADGAEALRLMEDAAVDLLVTDVVMPDMNGFELAREARQLHPGIILIYMSGFYTEAQRRSGPLGLMLTKPFRPSLLLDEVTKALGTSALD
ncbi:MAG: response regulator [Alphaproteobacteria bacterium]|nr:response regulator [Alphaproteobacteria bacterium]